jgi:hypothetical protein
MYSRVMKRSFSLQALLALVIGAVAVTALAGDGFIPVVAQTRGAGGSFWNTELWISNPTSRKGSYGLVFLPSGHDNTRLLSVEPEGRDIAAGATVHLTGVVPPNSTGALRVVTTDGLVVRCRVFNTRGRGSAGQMVPLLTVGTMIQPGERGILVPLLRGGQLRTNLGVFNPSPHAVAVQIEILDGSGETVGGASYNVEAGSQLQLNDVLLGFRVTGCERCRGIVTANGPVAAYAAVVDNRTGAATFIQPAIR